MTEICFEYPGERKEDVKGTASPCVITLLENAFADTNLRSHQRNQVASDMLCRVFGKPEDADGYEFFPAGEIPKGEELAVHDQSISGDDLLIRLEEWFDANPKGSRISVGDLERDELMQRVLTRLSGHPPMNQDYTAAMRWSWAPASRQ